MRRAWTKVALGALALTMLMGGCSRRASQSGPAPAASASSAAALAPASSSAAVAAASAYPARAVGPLPKPQDASIQTADGVKLGASLWVGGEANAPAVILAHRLGGSRAEWDPLVQRLFPPKQPINVLAIDLRGHGESSAKGGERHKLVWSSFKTDEFAKMSKDVAAAIEFMRKRAGGPPASLIVVGSDIGATAAVRAVHDMKAHVAGVCLISPGASLRGVDLYAPFASVLELPNLIISGAGDNVSRDPAVALRTMSKSSQEITLPSRDHSAEFLGQDKPSLWDMVADWVDRRAAVHD